MTFTTRIASAIVGFALVASPAAGQSKIEVFGSYPVPVRAASGTFSTDYVPQLVNGGSTEGGNAGQTLRLDGARPRGFLGGLNWIPGAHAGLQFFASRSAHELSGANTPNHIQLRYISRPPPDYMDYPVTIDRSFDWPDTDGEFSVWRIGASGLWRYSGRRADVTIGAGLLWSRFRGQFESASYTEFHLGGHSVLFSEEALARMHFEETWHLGYTAAIDIAMPTSSHVAVTAGLRLMPSPDHLAVTTEVTNTDQMIFTIPESTVRQQLGAQPAQFSRWGSPVITIGLRIR